MRIIVTACSFLFLTLANPAWGQPPADAPKPLPENVRAAWEKAGFKVGWVSRTPFALSFRSDTSPGKAGDMPAFTPDRFKGLGLINKVPEPEQAYGLNLNQTATPVEGLKELPSLKQLRALSIARNRLTLAHLKEVGKLQQLQALDVYGGDMIDAGLDELTGLTELQFLSIALCPVTDAGLKEVAGFKKLQVLCLAGCKGITAED